MTYYLLLIINRRGSPAVLFLTEQCVYADLSPFAKITAIGRERI